MLPNRKSALELHRLLTFLVGIAVVATMGASGCGAGVSGATGHAGSGGAGDGGAGAGGGTGHPSADLTAVIDWHMQPHFLGMDLANPPPPAQATCPPPPEGRYSEGPFACTDAGGNVGCRYALPTGDPLDFRSTPCLVQCQPNSVASCKTSCGSPGTESCRANGTWGACTAYEVCDGKDNDCDGIVDVSNGLAVCQTALSAWDPTHGPGWDTTLDGCGSTAKGAQLNRYRWEVSVSGRTVFSDQSACTLRFTFPVEGDYTVKLTVFDDRNRFSAQASREVSIKNIVIASLGDSVASGEGTPDGRISATNPSAEWEDRRCHRSMNAAHAVAAKALEDQDDHTSVTFTFLSCSGAEIDRGLINGYGGEEVIAGDQPATLHPQISELHRIMSNARPIDVVFLQAGANDMRFADIVTECAVPTVPGNGMADVFSCANDDNTNRIAARLADLENTRYPLLNDHLRANLPFAGTKVYISGYHDVTHDDDRSLCKEIRLVGAIKEGLVAKIPDAHAPFLASVAMSYLDPLGLGGITKLVDKALTGSDVNDGVINSTEVTWAYDKVIVPLNETVQRAAAANGWTFVAGWPGEFATHGYCADDHWVVHYDESKARQGNNQGTMHPNEQGHAALAKLLVAAVTKDLVASGVFTSDGGTGDGGPEDGGVPDVDASVGDAPQLDAPQDAPADFVTASDAPNDGADGLEAPDGGVDASDAGVSP